jgi:hypothetical protein
VELRRTCRRLVVWGVVVVTGLVAPALARADPTTFSYTGSVQTYLVPDGVTAVVIDASGAQGGGDHGADDPRQTGLEDVPAPVVRLPGPDRLLAGDLGPAR